MSSISFDRHWRRILGVSALLFIIGLAFLIVPLVFAFDQGILANPLNHPFDDSGLSGAGLYFLLGYICWVWGIRGRRRMRLRIRTLANEPDAAPVANALPFPLDSDEADTQDAGAEAETPPTSVLLRWRDSQYGRSGPILLGSASLVIGFLVGFALAIAAGVFGSQDALPAFAIVLIVLCAFFLPSGAGIWLFVRSVRRNRTASYTPDKLASELYADASGVTFWHGKRALVMRWDEMRLFEVSLPPPSAAKDGTPTRPYFTLWNGQSQAITWPAFSEERLYPSIFATEGDTIDDPIESQRELLRLIRHYSRLEPRTLSPELYRPNRRSREYDFSWQALQKQVFVPFIPVLLALAIFPLAGALIILLMPLTLYPLANVYGALWLGAIGLAAPMLLTIGLINSKRARQPQTPVPPPLVHLPAPPAQGDTETVYVLRRRPSWRDVALEWLLALGLLLNGVVAAYKPIAPGRVFPADTLGADLLSLAFDLLILLAGLGGIILFLSFVSLSGSTLLAAPDGLSRRWSKNAITFAWDTIVLAEARSTRKRVTSFRVLNTTGRAISWSASRSASMPQTPASEVTDHPNARGEVKITPEALMALVLARTGLKLEMVEANLFEN